MNGSERNKLCECGSGMKAKRCDCSAARALILTYDNPALKIVSTPLEREDVLGFLQLMKRACRASKYGIGLAANQIGVTKRAAWIDVDRINGFFMLNPTITRATDPRVGREECLSYPGVSVAVERFTEIKVFYYTELWEPRERLFTDLSAVCIQHEIDHLDGICKVGDEWRMLGVQMG